MLIDPAAIAAAHPQHNLPSNIHPVDTPRQPLLLVQ
jgi:hypothetical protein